MKKQENELWTSYIYVYLFIIVYYFKEKIIVVNLVTIEKYTMFTEKIASRAIDH